MKLRDIAIARSGDKGNRATLSVIALDPGNYARIERLLHIAEYKRRQAPPGVKIGRRNFGRDRRYPITNAFRDAT